MEGGTRRAPIFASFEATGVKDAKEEEGDKTWLSFASFPEEKSKELCGVVKGEDRKHVNASDDEYIEFDADLFDTNVKVTSTREKVKKYKGGSSELWRKSLKLKRRALKELSKGKPIVFDKYNIYKLTFVIDLKGDKRLALTSMYQKSNQAPVKYYKTRGVMTLGMNPYSSIIARSQRFYMVKLIGQPMRCSYEVDEKKQLPWGQVVPVPLGETVCTEDAKVNMDPSICDPYSEVYLEVSSLNRRVSENPRDIEAWLKLVQLQRKKVGSNTSEAVILECQMAVLLKAISHNPSSEDLLLFQLQLNYNIADPLPFRKALEDIVFKFPQKMCFWIHYFYFNQSEFSRLNHSTTCNMYAKALSKIEMLKSSSVRSSQHLKEPRGSQFQLRIYSLLALYLLCSDCTEKMIALFQLLLELNLTNIKGTTLEQVKMDALNLYLETFWDSEHPRIGEDGAQGFGYYYQISTGNQTPTSIFNPNNLIQWNKIFTQKPPAEDDAYTIEECTLKEMKVEPSIAWAVIESYRCSRGMIPARGSSENTVDDLERVILFEDVSCFLFKLDDSVLYDLVLLFLLLLGVPIPHKYSTLLAEHFKDSLITSDFVLQYPQLLSQFEMITGGSILCLHRGLSPIWLHFNSESPVSHRPEHDISILIFIRNLFSQILSMDRWNVEQVQALSMTWLQFEILLALQSPSLGNEAFDKVMSLAQLLLELIPNRSYSPMWVTYSFCLIYCGNIQKYSKTMIRLTKAYSSQLDNHSIYSYALFVRFYVEAVVLNNLIGTEGANNSSSLLELIQKLFAIALDGVCHGGKFEPLSYENSMMKKFALLSSEYDGIVHATNIIMCQFFGAYLCNKVALGITSVMKWIEWASNRCFVRQNGRDDVTATSCGFTSLRYIRCMKKIEYDAHLPAYTLCKLTSEQFSVIAWHPLMAAYVDYSRLSRLARLCAEMFPDSVMIQQWYYKHTQDVPVATAFRMFYDQLAYEAYESTSSNVCSWIFSVYSEVSYINRIERAQSSNYQNVEVILKNSSAACRLRSIFEPVLQHPIHRFKPLLWRIYMRVQKIIGDTEAIKSVFYRSLQHTPWCKELYMDAIHMGILDHRSVLDMLTEKGIRVRLPYEEFQLLSQTNAQ